MPLNGRIVLRAPKADAWGAGMKLFTKEVTSQLLANGRQQQPVRGTADEIDFEPVVKLFTPWVTLPGS